MTTDQEHNPLDSLQSESGLPARMRARSPLSQKGEWLEQQSMPESATLADTESDAFEQLFQQEDQQASELETATPVWKILVVDDEGDVHAAMRLALEDISIAGRTLQLLCAFSKEEALQLLQQDDEIALVLLDVVMETEQAGLELVRDIREKLDNHIIQIAIVTGQPGYAPEQAVVEAYEINDYRLKSDLSATKLMTLVYSAIRNYKALCDLVASQKALKQMAVAREQAEQRYQDLYDHAPDLFVSVDAASAKIIQCNQTLVERLGYRDKDEIIGHLIFDLYDSSCMSQVHRAFRSFVETGEVKDTELRLLQRNGEPIDVSLNVTAVRDEQGQILYSRSSWRDITKRKQAEKALIESEKRNRLLLESLGEGVIGVDIDGKCSFVNLAALELLGFQEHELLGQEMHHLMHHLIHHSFLDGQPYPLTDCPMEASLIEGVKSVKEDEVLWRKDGTPLPVEYCSVPICQDKTIVGSVIIFHDITERKRHAEELQQYQTHLEELVQSRTQELEVARNIAEAANHAKSIFLANMSHELRTPLNAILGFAQLIAQDERIPTDEKQNLETINRSGQHLLSLINDVLEISKIEAGRLTLTPELVNLNELLTGLSEVMAIRAQQQGLAFSLDKSSELPLCIEIDVTKLRQILINLISNAIKFTKVGEVRTTVSSEQTDERLCLVIDVSDTGAGVAEQDLERIFSPFYQTKYGILVGEGTGLGLTISQEYTKLLGGELSAESQVGQGSVFHLRLPVKQVAAPETGTAQHGRVIGLAPGQPSYRILVAEDNLDNQRLISTLLERAGFRVRVVADGQQAIEQVYSWQPHFIWMDMRMPVLDGYEATKRLKAIPEGANIKIAALTASAFAEDRDSILAAGCDAFVRKPIKQAELFQVMHELLGVQYCYDDQLQSNQQPSRQIDPQIIAQLPKALQDELQKAAEQLDQEALMQISEQVRQYASSLADSLRLLAREFRFDLVLTALENAHTPEE